MRVGTPKAFTKRLDPLKMKASERAHLLKLGAGEKRILVLGDSHSVDLQQTQKGDGLGSRLADFLRARGPEVDVVAGGGAKPSNYASGARWRPSWYSAEGFEDASGVKNQFLETTRTAVEPTDVKKILESACYDRVVVQLGSNIAVLHGPNETEAQAKARMTQEVKGLLERIRESRNGTPIIQWVGPPARTPAKGKDLYQGKLTEQSIRWVYEVLEEQLAKEPKAVLVDLRPLSPNKTKDGCHFTPAEYEAMACRLNQQM